MEQEDSHVCAHSFMPNTLKHSQNVIHARIQKKCFDRTFIRELYTSMKKDPQTFLIVHLHRSEIAGFFSLEKVYMELGKIGSHVEEGRH